MTQPINTEQIQYVTQIEFKQVIAELKREIVTKEKITDVREVDIEKSERREDKIMNAISYLKKDIDQKIELEISKSKV